jgi:outer membrane lipoprotein-sorting protein
MRLALNFIRFSMVAMFMSTLGACANNPKIESGSTIADFANSVSDKEYKFNLAGGLPQISGDRHPLFGYVALSLALAPVQSHCTNSGGKITSGAWQEFGLVRVPGRLTCIANGAIVWEFAPGYTKVRTSEAVNGRWAFMTIKPYLLSGIQVAERDKFEANENQAQKAKESIKLALDAKLKQEHITKFRLSVKPGDRFKWHGVERGPATGMIVRIEGEMTFVQFDNMMISGQSTRYVRRDELEPLE